MRSLLLVLLAIGCGQALPPTDAGTFDAGVTTADAGHDAGLEVDAGFCAENTVTLRVRTFSDTERYYVDIVRDGGAFALQLDTGSDRTFIFQGPGAPPFTPVLGTVTLGCEELPIAGRNLSSAPDQIDGRPIIGLLGMDWLLKRPSLLDVGARRLTRLAQTSRAPLEASARFSFAFDDVQGLALVPCRLDGVPVRLMFDTGGGHTLWVGVDGGPGDRLEEVVDAVGNIFPIWVGTGTLGLSDAGTRTIPLARAPEFPYFAQTVAALGGNLHGLLGVTAFPNERLLVDGDAGRMFVLP